MTDNFEERIRKLTWPINRQLPRPWMTDMSNPLKADVFIVGMNQAKLYRVEEVSHERHIDALFNRNGESCRGLYDEVTGGKPSPTRRNIDGLAARLRRQGTYNILETDVVCYSTPMSGDLRDRAHAGGAPKGEEIFRYLLDVIAPPVLIVHGARAVNRLSRILKIKGLKVPETAGEVHGIQTNQHLVIPIRSLAPPEFNKWSSWSGGHLDKVSDRVRDKLGAEC